MAMLLNCIEQGAPFVRYGAIREELERRLDIAKIFPTQIGHPAGAMMDAILKVDGKAPLINVLVTKADGIPGRGAGLYLSQRYNNPSLRDWDSVAKERKLEIVAQERRKVFAYERWDEISTLAFGDLSSTREETACKSDRLGWTHGYGGEPKSAAHRNLKEWVAQHPEEIGLSRKYGDGKLEQPLLSGDSVDVMFSFEGIEFRAVEVKSIRSSDADFQRGIYQCVKYREVKRAECSPFKVDVKSILVTERQLPEDLLARARDLKIRVKVVSVDR